MEAEQIEFNEENQMPVERLDEEDFDNEDLRVADLLGTPYFFGIF